MENSELNKSLTEEYLEILDYRKYSFNTIRNYRSALNALNDYLGDSKMLQHVEQNDIIMFLTRQNYLSDATFNARLSAIRSFFNYLLDIRVINKQPVTKYMFRRREWIEPTALTKTQVHQYINLCKKARLHQEIGAKIMYATGLRLSELIGLDLVKDVEIRDGNGFVHVRRSKGKTPRVVPIFKQSVTDEIIKTRELFFKTGSCQLHLSKHSFLYYNRLYYAKYGERVTPHMFRHTFATERFEEGMDINTIRILLGHKSLGMTLLYIANRIDIYNLIA